MLFSERHFWKNNSEQQIGLSARNGKLSSAGYLDNAILLTTGHKLVPFIATEEASPAGLTPLHLSYFRHMILEGSLVQRYRAFLQHVDLLSAATG